MNEERSKAVFDIRELTYLLDGGEKATLVRRKRTTKVFADLDRLIFLYQ